MQIIKRNLNKDPYKHQYDALDFISEKKQFALFMEQGTGKSKVVLMKAFEMAEKGLIDRLLILCPNAIKNQWVKEVLEEHCPLEYEAIAWNGLGTHGKRVHFRRVLESDLFKIMSVNYDAFQTKTVIPYLRQFLADGNPLIICDESTKIKNPKAKRTELILKGFEKRIYKGILTGTPTPNNPFDLWSQFEFLQKGFWKMSYFHFQHHHCIMMKRTNPNTGRPFNTPIDEETYLRIKKLLLIEKEQTPVLTELSFEKVACKVDLKMKDIMIINNMKTYSPYKNLQELKSKIDPLTFYIKKEDCIDLPDKVYEKLECEMSAEQIRTMKELKKELMTEYQGKILTSQNIVSVTLRCQMITGGIFPYLEFDKEGKVKTGSKIEFMSGNPKITALLDDLETVSKETSIIIWASFVGELKLIHKKLQENKYSVELYYGETIETERQRIEEDFKNKKFQILVINPALGEFGLNFQISTLHYFYSNSFRADRRLQAEDRSHRIGQKNKVTYKDIICRNSIDEKILTILKQKEDLINFFRNKPIEKIIEF